MLKEHTAENKSVRDSSDSGYNLDNLDLLHLPFSLIGGRSNQNNDSDFSGRGDNNTINALTKASQTYKREKYHCFGDYEYDCNSRLASQYINPAPSKLAPTNTKPSCVYLYRNQSQFNQDSANRVTSDEFLVPIYKRKKLRERLSNNKVDIGLRNNEPSDSKTLFPFKPTPSGNLKIDSRQVAFQSDRVSVLIADPLNTTVNIKNTDLIGIETNGTGNQNQLIKNCTMDAIMTQQGLSSSLGSLLAGRLDAPVRKEKEAVEYEGRDTETILDPEINLNRLGYTACETICWKEVCLPEKKNLYLELYSRITNFANADCKVYIDNEEFNCHLIVLQCYSEVFDTYVAVKKVELPADRCSPSSFAFIYEWMITGDPSYRELNRENVLDIFNAAKYLKIKDLIEQCWAFIDNIEVFTEDTAFLLYIDAKEKNLPEVRELMLPRIQKFFLMLVSSQDWLELDFEDVRSFLQSNYVCVNCEMEIFMSAVRWLKHDITNRSRAKVDVLSCVRFGNIAPWQLVDIKRNPDNPDFSSLAMDPDICKMIDDGLAFVIIKYWYGQENDDFQHWNSILALKEPVGRNWSGMDKTYFTYREFLIYLDQYRRQQMFEKSAPKDKQRRSGGPSGSTAGGPTANGKNSPCGKCDDMMPSMEKMIIIPPQPSKVPTADDFLATRRTTEYCYDVRTEHIIPNSNSGSPRRLTNTSRKRTRCLGKNQAAIIIQSHYRGYRDRKYIAQLKKNRFSKQSKYVSRNRLPWNIKSETEKRDIFLKRDPGAGKVLTMFENKSGDEHQSSKMSGKKATHAGIFALKKKDLISENSLFYSEHECVLIFGGVDQHSTYGVGRNTSNDIFRYVPDNNVWEFVGSIPEPRCYHSVGFLQGRVYLMGGLDPRDDEVKDLMWSFEPVTRTWYTEGNLNHARSCFGLVVTNKMLYAIGGKDSQGRVTGSVERYDPVTSCWDFVAALRHPRMGIACAKFEDKIWVAGGMSGSKKRPLSDSVECYDVENNQWTDIVKLRRARGFACLFPMANNLYIIGGAGKSADDTGATCSFNTIEVWNRERSRWEDHVDMEVARHGATVAYLGTQILIIGGVTTTYMRSLTNIECFCTTRNTWIRGMAVLPSPLSGHATVTLPPAVLM